MTDPTAGGETLPGPARFLFAGCTTSAHDCPARYDGYGGTLLCSCACHADGLHEWRQAAYQATRERDAARKQLGLASEFRIPCPGHLYNSHHSDLLVRRNPDGQGWCIINPNWPDGGEHVWDDQNWRYRGELSRTQIYRYSRDEALAEAPKLAAAEAARSQTWAAEMRERGTR